MYQQKFREIIDLYRLLGVEEKDICHAYFPPDKNEIISKSWYLEFGEKTLDDIARVLGYKLDAEWPCLQMDGLIKTLGFVPTDGFFFDLYRKKYPCRDCFSDKAAQGGCVVRSLARRIKFARIKPFKPKPTVHVYTSAYN